jgi:peptidoglycan/xylan/chitin deacetylase (PgdA/CDA1 family)
MIARPRRTHRRLPGRIPARLVVLFAALAVVGACAPAPPASATPGASAAPSADPSPTGSAAASPVASSTPTPSPTPLPSSTPVAWVVQPGDTLTSIARRFDTTARSIAWWNRATYPSLDPTSPDYSPNRIEVGWTLVVLPGEVVDDASPPPGASPTPRPTLVIPPGPTPRPDGTAIVVDHGPRAANAVALTFDLGGRVDPALDIVDWLLANDVPATIFPTGATATATATGRDVLARIAANPGLLGVGNHTWDHPDLTELDAAAIEDQLRRTETAIEEATGRSPQPFMRPPFGSHDLETREVAGRLGYPYVVMWDIDTIDWKPVAEGGPTADDIVARVLARVQGGSIVLMHLGGYETLDALPGIVAGLRDRGLEPVTLARLLGTE